MGITTYCFPFSLPPERQFQIVDMERDDMDMLEWLVRYVIPIPKRYYWESSTTNTSLPAHVRVWHDMIGLFDTCIQWLDQKSEPWIQPTTSRFEYVRSTMTPQQLERFQKQQVELRNKRQRTSGKDDNSQFVVRGSE
jgi:hypothetical protein